MPKNLMKESHLRKIVKVLLEDKTLGPAMIKVNPVVDPSAAVTDPDNADFKPMSKPELTVALSAMIDDMPDVNVPNLYDSIKDALTAQEDEKGKEQMGKSNEKVEESIRMAIRKMLQESDIIKEYYAKDPETGEMVWKGVGPAPKLAPSAGIKKLGPEERGIPQGPDTPEVKGLRKKLKTMVDFEPEQVDSDKPAKGRGRKNVMTGGDPFKDLAKKLGFSYASGAKAAVIKALAKAKFAAEMDPDELEILVLNAMNDYINLLNSSGELTPADVKLLKDHPDIVRELDGFREYLDSKIRKARKGAGGK